jgi:hypothetical protein
MRDPKFQRMLYIFADTTQRDGFTQVQSEPCEGCEFLQTAASQQYSHKISH